MPSTRRHLWKILDTKIPTLRDLIKVSLYTPLIFLHYLKLPRPSNHRTAWEHA